MNLLGILVFASLVAGDIILRKRTEWHKRLMRCATISILGPGLSRLLPMDSFGVAAPLVMFGVIALFAFAGPVADLTASREMHPAYYWGVATILMSMAIIPPVAVSPIGSAALPSLGQAKAGSLGSGFWAGTIFLQWGYEGAEPIRRAW